MKTVITFVLSYLAGRYVAQYGAENEWSLTKVMLFACLAGAFVGFISSFIFV